MPLNLRLSILVIAIILLIVILKVLNKELIPVKYSLLWMVGIIVLLVLAIWPNLLVYFANYLGFQTIANMVTGVMFVILIFITISLTVIVSGQKRRIIQLVQEVSLLRRKINDIDSKGD